MEEQRQRLKVNDILALRCIALSQDSQEKRMGRKKFSEVLGKFVVKPMGAPQLVPESDPRKPYSDAASDFSN